jgi:tRNA pseudouridine55 synthase
VNGVIVIDKPEGLSSAQVVARLKRCLGGLKVGHTGTLDPFASGVMICCVSRATKLARYFLHGGKSYLATLCLGIETDTQDATGQVTASSSTAGISEAAVIECLAQFKGDMLQLPPVYSALKHKGTPLYKLARSGKPVQKPARQVHISALKVMKMDLPEVSFFVTCSAGTYIRTLCADIGRQLGCGGHLKALRRVESCGFDISESIRLDQAIDPATADNITSRIIPMAEALRNMPCYVADSRLAALVTHGRPLTTQDLQLEGDATRGPYVKIIDTQKHLLAVLRTDDNVVKYDCIFRK